jgi:hypothetical protein
VVAGHLKPPCVAAASAALRAGGPPSASSAAQLAALIAHPRTPAAAASAAAACLVAAASASQSARLVALAPPRGCAGGAVVAIAALLRTPARLKALPARLAASLAGLIGTFGADATSRAALASLGVNPLATLLDVYCAADTLPGTLAAATSATVPADRSGAALGPNGAPFTSDDVARADATAAAAKVYDAAAVAVRRAALAALAPLCADAGLLRAEAFTRTKAVRFHFPNHSPNHFPNPS